MKKLIAMVLIVITGFLSGVVLAEGNHDVAKKEIKSQERCPVMGGKINKKLYYDYDGKRIYVCCKGCISKIKTDPKKYIKQLETKGITLDKAEGKNKKTEKKQK